VPFYLVLVLKKPAFDSGLGYQTLRNIYQMSYRPFYESLIKKNEEVIFSLKNRTSELSELVA